eukprot:TRINITY_DN7853_c0_g1_i1.p1 TRINITY_DN7853_c0_g1~~TRINITY_DN7853_c0_g1_i1.p1  ORF type:complete len:1027 (-),score=176.48 TRINITY_DN7853_c0_g1_i1:35-3115(-)
MSHHTRSHSGVKRTLPPRPSGPPPPTPLPSLPSTPQAPDSPGTTPLSAREVSFVAPSDTPASPQKTGTPRRPLPSTTHASGTGQPTTETATPPLPSHEAPPPTTATTGSVATTAPPLSAPCTTTPTSVSFSTPPPRPTSAAPTASRYKSGGSGIGASAIMSMSQQLNIPSPPSSPSASSSPDLKPQAITNTLSGSKSMRSTSMHNLQMHLVNGGGSASASERASHRSTVKPGSLAGSQSLGGSGGSGIVVGSGGAGAGGSGASAGSGSNIETRPVARARDRHTLMPTLSVPHIDKSTFRIRTSPTLTTSSPPSVDNGETTFTLEKSHSAGSTITRAGAESITFGMSEASDDKIKTDFQASRKLDDDPKRANIILEILHTEETYIANVEQMIRNYKSPLKILAATDPEINAEDMKNLFSNIHLILPLNQELLKNINDRINNWSPSQMIGDVFLRMAPFLKMYNDYSNNYKYALGIYNMYCEKSPKFVDTLQACKASCKPPLNLESLLINPIQRIPRYNLLLEDLLRHTDESHVDYQNLTKALAVTKEVAAHINQSVRTTENLRKLAEASSKGTGFKNLIKADRKLVRDGFLQTTDNKGHKEKLHFFLFNDILVFASKSDLKKQKDMTKVNSQWPINLVWMATSVVSLELIGPTKVFTIATSSGDDIDAWTKDLKSVLSVFDPDRREGTYDFGPGRYSGSWYKGKIHGRGEYTSFGGKYSGEFKDGRKHGEGIMRYSTLDTYTGVWANNLQNGQGTLTCANGTTFSGEWKDGKKHNYGTIFYANGDTYAGGWREDKPYGDGKLAMKSGITYEGAWEEGKFHGRGTLTFGDGRCYAGEFINGLKEGRGVMVYHDGERFEGQWKEDKRHGVGTHTVPDGWMSKYTGSWVTDNKEGQGTMIYSDGSAYEGTWKNDLPSGRGVLTKTSGDVYTGQFKRGLPHGNGVMRYGQSGVEFSGRFVRGQKESGKCIVSRPVQEEERREAQENGFVPLDKLAGTYDSKDGGVWGTHAGDGFEVYLVPELPSFDFVYAL